jgi:hypothetical protein
VTTCCSRWNAHISSERPTFLLVDMSPYLTNAFQLLLLLLTIACCVLTATPLQERPKLPAAWLPDVEAAVAAYEATWAVGAELQGSAQPPDDILLQA